MTPEQLVQILVALNIAGLLTNGLQWWTKRQEVSATHRYTTDDTVRLRDQAREERLLTRIQELERAQADREAAMQIELHELRQGLEECQAQHTQAQIVAATLQAENNTMKRQLDQLMGSLERRRHDSGPPRGTEERRTR